MKSIFEPLLHANARAFAILGGVLFLAMLGWSVYAEYSASRQPGQGEESPSHTEAPDFPAHEPLGILAYVESQTAPGSESSHLPVDLFRPPVDDEGNPVRPGTTLHLQKPEESGAKTAEGGEEVPEEVAKLVEEAQKKLGTGDGGKNGGGGWKFGGGGRPGTAGTPDRTLRYAGVFKRSDGALAAWVADSAGGGSFVTPGAEIAGATILDGSDLEHVRVRLADGTEATLERGGEPVVVEHGKPGQPAVGKSGGGGGDGNRPRRMPTEEEIAEIEKRDPELARRIRQAIKKHKK